MHLPITLIYLENSGLTSKNMKNQLNINSKNPKNRLLKVSRRPEDGLNDQKLTKTYQNMRALMPQKLVYVALQGAWNMQQTL